MVIDRFAIILEVVLRPQGQQEFVILPNERTYGWPHWCRPD